MFTAIGIGCFLFGAYLMKKAVDHFSESMFAAMIDEMVEQIRDFRDRGTHNGTG